MRRYMTVCIDKETEKEIVLDNCGYNEACFWLDGVLAKNGKQVINTNKQGKLIKIETNAKTNFYYDKSRMMLLKD